MATQIKTSARILYQDDPYLWARAQAVLLCDRRFAELDLANLVEEVEELAGAMRRSVRNRTITIMMHLLKLQHSLASDPRLGWRETIRTQRTRLLNDLTSSLRRELEGELAEIYARARHDAEASLRDHGKQAAADALPEVCPYGMNEIEATGCRERGPARRPTRDQCSRTTSQTGLRAPRGHRSRYSAPSSNQTRNTKRSAENTPCSGPCSRSSWAIRSLRLA